MTYYLLGKCDKPTIIIPESPSPLIDSPAPLTPISGTDQTQTGLTPPMQKKSASPDQLSNLST